jgi:plastocyanin
MISKNKIVLLILGILAVTAVTGVLITSGVFKKNGKSENPLATSAPAYSNSNAPISGVVSATNGVSAPSGVVIVNIENFAFNPSELVVNAGTKVKWVQNDSVPHRVVSSDNIFESGNLAKGESFIFEFNSPGEYDYFCGIHPSMKGKIIVK